MTTVAGISSEGAEAVVTASARPAAAAAVHEGVPLIPALAGMWSPVASPGEALALNLPWPTAEPVARNRPRTTSGSMICAINAPARPWFRAAWSAGAAAQESAATRRSRRLTVSPPAANQALRPDSGAPRRSSHAMDGLASPPPRMPIIQRT